MRAFRCQGEGCEGVVEPDKAQPVAYRTGINECEDTYPCGKCGKLHRRNGMPIERRRDNAEVFFIKGELVHKKNGKVVKSKF